MSDTPKTDAEAGYYDDSGCWHHRTNGENVDADFARTLERELTAAKAEVEALRALIRLDDAEWHRSDTSGDSAATELHGPDPYAATRRAIVRRCC